MEWYWTALLFGLIALWFFMGERIVAGFQAGRLLESVSIWLGTCLLTIPAMLLIFGLARLVSG